MSGSRLPSSQPWLQRETCTESQSLPTCLSG